MAYDETGKGGLDYIPCRYGRSKLLFRGPRKKLDSPYVAVLGGTETYGRFVEEPFPAMLERLSGYNVVNLGCPNAGTDVFFHDETVIEICANARTTIIQLTGAHNMSNRFYTVHPRRNDRFLRASNLLNTVFREVDFTEYNFTRHLVSDLAKGSTEKFAMMRDELKEAWVGRMQSLIKRINGQVVLLWLSDRAPPRRIEDTEIGSEPVFVDQEMLDRLRSETTHVEIVVASAEEIRAGQERMVFGVMEEPAAREQLGVVIHEAVALRLRALLDRLQ